MKPTQYLWENSHIKEPVLDFFFILPLMRSHDPFVTCHLQLGWKGTSTRMEEDSQVLFNKL